MNTASIKTPGVYIDEVSLLPPSVAGVETGIPAFIGYTQKAVTASGDPLTKVPYRIGSLREYIENYGTGEPEDDLELKITDYVDAAGTVTLSTRIEAGFSTAPTKGANKRNMYYALELYFANGGGACYIVSVGNYAAAFLKKTLKDDGLDMIESEDEPTMIVFPEAIHLGATDQMDLYNDALMQAARLKDRVVIMDVLQNDGKTISQDMTAFRAKLKAGNLHFGAAYYPYLDTTIDFDYTGKEDKIKIVHIKVKPDGSDGGVGTSNGKMLDAIAATDNLLYNTLKNKLSQVPVTLPPSAAMAGVFARVDAERGVWKAPANVGVASVIGPSIKVADADQDGMNVDPVGGMSVNAIRTITGRGTVVWGARTLDGNSNEWRYIPVRRYFNYVEESVKKATYRFVFEPNDANTWVKVRGMIENFLTNQWRDGALQGAKPEDAFFVRIGLGQTMTAVDVLEGRMIVEIGMAVVRPAEFIILRFMHKLAE